MNWTHTHKHNKHRDRQTDTAERDREIENEAKTDSDETNGRKHRRAGSVGRYSLKQSIMGEELRRVESPHKHLFSTR